MDIDVLLIHTHVTLNERYGSKKMKEAIGGNLPPLGVAHIASYLKQNGFQVKIIDTSVAGFDINNIVKEIACLKPRFIGLSSITAAFHRALKLAETIKNVFPDILLAIGGHHATIMKNNLLADYPCFDILAYGEGEYTALELISKFKDHSYDTQSFIKDTDCLGVLKGIVYRRKGEIIVNSPREPIVDLDNLPDPSWELLDMQKYIPLPNCYLRKPVVNMVTARGCPFSCSFCSNNSVFGRHIRRMSPERVISAFEHAQRIFKAKEIYFFDDTMTVDKAWIEKLCNIILDKKIDVTWTCVTRVDAVSRELLKLMKKAGCWNIFYGFESAEQDLLDNINKGITIEQSRQAVKWTKEAGIEIRASFMLALPGETPELARKTIDFAIELDPDYAQFCITTPYPGTKLFAEADRFGFLSKDFSQYSIWNPVFVPLGYEDKDEVFKMEKEAMRRFYLRPKYIIKRLMRIRSFEDIKRNYKGLKMLSGF